MAFYKEGRERGWRNGGCSFFALRFDVFETPSREGEKELVCTIMITPKRKMQGRCEQKSSACSHFLHRSLQTSSLFCFVSLDVRWASLPSLYHSTWEKGLLLFGYGTYVRCAFSYTTREKKEQNNRPKKSVGKDQIAKNDSTSIIVPHCHPFIHLPAHNNNLHPKTQTECFHHNLALTTTITSSSSSIIPTVIITRDLDTA